MIGTRKKIVVVGSSNTDMTVKAGKLPSPGETILGDSFNMYSGGKGANQAVAAARMGGDVSFICKMGRDVFGENSLKGYIRDGIDISHILYSERPSGMALIMVDSGGENIISVAPGANGDLTPDDIESVRGELENAGYVMLQLEIPVESTLKAARIAHEAGATVILNPAPAVRLPEEIFGYIDILIPNQTEAAILTGITNDAAAAVRKLSGMGVGDVVMTLGGRGCAVYTRGMVEEIPALKVDVVDASAAGDTFCGALCVALCEGLGLAEAARFATRAAALTVCKPGTQSSIPFRKDIK